MFYFPGREEFFDQSKAGEVWGDGVLTNKEYWDTLEGCRGLVMKYI
jgi:hypothetical protein